MITSIRLRDFKNFADETLRLGPFTVIVGANASGKSNIRDAFRFLHGIGRGYTLADIIGGKYGDGGYVEWRQMRGGADEITRFGCQSFSISIEIKTSDSVRMRYTIETATGRKNYYDGFQLMNEELDGIGRETIYTNRLVDSNPIREQDDDLLLILRLAKYRGLNEQNEFAMLTRERPFLTQFDQNPEFRKFMETYHDDIDLAVKSFTGMKFLDLAPDRMRPPSFPRQTVLGDSGENLPTVLQGICADERRKKTLISWTRELTPMDVEDFAFPVDPNSGRVGLAIREANGRKISAYSASDGTLRFLAMLAALLGPDPARLYFFEEIDNGIHPSRLHLLLELIERQTEERGIQVVATTHSPALLTAMGDRTFENTSVVCRLPDTDNAIIRPLKDIPNARDLRKEQGMGRLLEGGWMETALYFTEAAE